jgi:glycosyltransferase involved in cell wall biosynthesis
MLKLSAVMATRWGDVLIIDNHPSIEYFRDKWGVEGTYIAYGADRDRPTGTDYIESLGLKPREYLLFVGALVPDKGPDVLIDAYSRIETDLPLIVVGDSPFADDYRKALHEAAARDDRVRMLGYVYGPQYRELLANAYAYMHPLRSDGTSPALLQAMGYGSCIVINSNVEALSAVGDAAIPYANNDVADLARKLEEVLAHPELAAEYRARALLRAEQEYDWEQVTAAHGRIYADQARLATRSST